MSAPAASERLKKGFDRWDFDGNGALDRADFEEERPRIAEGVEKEAGSADIQRLRDTYGAPFDAIQQEAGGASDGSLADEHFIRVTENLILEQGEGSFNRVLGKTMSNVQAKWGLCDKNTDGEINADEFATVLTALGMSKAAAAVAFNQVDTDGNGELSIDEALTAVPDLQFGRLLAELRG
uniref:Calcium binding protein A n=1 Tax=Streptomyces ambofaciens TaxID=1889 RepID=Q9F1V5_STRAM|nr:calcium binding protein A [Streptomyces ambofaciens]